jgi:GntR family transcriptional regulator
MIYTLGLYEKAMPNALDFREKLESELELLSAEACLKGMSQEEFLKICKEMFQNMHPTSVEG